MTIVKVISLYANFPKIENPNPNTSHSNILFFFQHSQFSEMLKQCAKRACYTTLQKHDLLQPLPFENDQQFDCLLSVAVTTYLSKLSSLFH